MPDTSSTALAKAAETYRAQRVISYPFPENHKQYDLLLELAFMEGAQWYQGQQIEKIQERLGELKQQLAEVANAR